MGDAGYILAGPIGREVLSWGTISTLGGPVKAWSFADISEVFAIFATGSQLFAGMNISLSQGRIG